MTELACAAGVALLMDYLEGEVSAEIRGALDSHVASCPRCVAFVAAYRATPRILREATAAELPADLQRSFLAALRSRRESEP